MLRRRILALGLSVVGLLLLLPTASRACDPMMLSAFVALGKQMKCLPSLNAKASAVSGGCCTYGVWDRGEFSCYAETWWQGEPETLEAAATKWLERAKEEEAEYEYLVARINDLAGAKEAALFAYRTIHQTKEGCAYWEMATHRYHELEVEVAVSNKRDGSGFESWDCGGGIMMLAHVEPEPELKALVEEYERKVSFPLILKRYAGKEPCLLPLQRGVHGVFEGDHSSGRTYAF